MWSYSRIDYSIWIFSIYDVNTDDFIARVFNLLKLTHDLTDVGKTFSRLLRWNRFTYLPPESFWVQCWQSKTLARPYEQLIIN